MNECAHCSGVGPSIIGKRSSDRPLPHGPALAQALPADQRAPERKECLVNIGPLVVADAQAAKLIEPGKCPLDDPPPLAQATPVLGAAHRQPGHDVPRPKTAPNRRRVVAAIPEHTVRPLPRSPPSAMQSGNRIHQRQGFLRVVPVRASEANRERHAPPVAGQMTFAPALGAIGRVRTGLVTAVRRADGTTVHDRARPINLVVAARANPVPQSGSGPTHVPVASRAGAASTSSPIRNRVPAGASARECRCEGRRQCRSDTRDPRRAAVRPLVDGVESATTVGLDPTTRLEAAWRPYPIYATSRTKIRLRRFCYARSKGPLYLVLPFGCR
jgi:hypothetical protein